MIPPNPHLTTTAHLTITARLTTTTAHLTTTTHLTIAALLAAATLLTAACGPPSADPTLDAASPLRASTLDVDDTHGFSGLTALDDAHLIAVAERRAVVRLRREGDRLLPHGPPLTLEGFPDGLDLESVAALPDERLAIGTESQSDAAPIGQLLLVDVSSHHARVTRRLEVDYDALWGLPTATVNQGIEGLCATSDRLLIANETVVTSPDGRRLAPVAMMTLADERWTPLWFTLTSDTGKLSALTCYEDAQGLSVLAIERHYGVSRLLWYRLTGADPPLTRLDPTRVLDLTPLLTDAPNLEGLARLGDGTLLIISDNQGAFVSGPTRVWTRPPDAPGHLNMGLDSRF